MNPASFESLSTGRRAFLVLVLVAGSVLGAYFVLSALDQWSRPTTCDRAVMQPGDTCAYIRTKTVSVEAYTPAGVQPIRRPAQHFGNDYRHVQQIHVRDTNGMRSEDRREATFVGLLGAATLASCVGLTMKVVRSRPGGPARR